MVQVSTRVDVADNTGARIAQCIRVYGSSLAIPGMLIVVSVKRALARRKISKGDVLTGVVATSRRILARKTGGQIKSDFNTIIMVKKSELEPLSNRVLFPVYIELRRGGFSKIVSLAHDVV
jgi:large subunit ribosomal protein L14